MRRHRRYGLHDDPVPPPIFDMPIDPGVPAPSPPVIDIPSFDPGIPPPSPLRFPISPGAPPPVSSGGTPKTGLSPLVLLGGGLLLFFAMSKGKR